MSRACSAVKIALVHTTGFFEEVITGEIIFHWLGLFIVYIFLEGLIENLVGFVEDIYL